MILAPGRQSDPDIAMCCQDCSLPSAQHWMDAAHRESFEREGKASEGSRTVVLRLQPRAKSEGRMCTVLGTFLEASSAISMFSDQDTCNKAQ